MMNARALVPLTIALLAGTESAQLKSIVGPPVVPVGCPVSIAVSNDTNNVEVTNICPYRIFDDQGELVYQPVCVLIALLMPPGNTFSTTWDQINNVPQQVPAGEYTVEVTLPNGVVELHDIEIVDELDGAIAAVGIPKVGETRELLFCAPDGANTDYIGMASLSSNFGIPICSGTIPLDPDSVFLASLTNPSIFQNFVGTLNADGVTTDPALAVPDLPALVGAQMTLAFVLFDPLETCPFPGISAPTTITIE